MQAIIEYSLPTLKGVQQAFKIGTMEVDIYMKDYSIFVIFSKKALTIFFFNLFSYQVSQVISRL